jgi:chorismate--pyruvate lyase
MFVMNKYDLKPNWKTPSLFSRATLESKMARWLLFPGSFTKKARVYSSSETPLTIKVLNEGLVLVDSDSYEYQLFNCRYAFIREIEIYIGDQKLMYAKSALSSTAGVLDKWRFRNLGGKPLGEMLFNKQAFSRKELKIAKITKDNPAFYLAMDSTNSAEFIWARRSIFTGRTQILLTEYFSPYLQEL